MEFKTADRTNPLTHKTVVISYGTQVPSVQVVYLDHLTCRTAGKNNNISFTHYKTMGQCFHGVFSQEFNIWVWHVDSEMRLCRWGTRIVFVAGGKLKQGSQSVIGYPVWGNYPLYPPHPPSPPLTPPPKKVELSILILLAQSCLSFNMKPLTDVKSHC